MHDRIRPERPKYHEYYALSALDQIVSLTRGDRAPLRFALAPGFHISRLWRSVSTFFAKPPARRGAAFLFAQVLASAQFSRLLLFPVLDYSLRKFCHH
jgi:hypothetical protein